MSQLISNYRFLDTKTNAKNALLVAFSEHVKELRQRFFQSLINITLAIIFFFLNIDWLVQMLANIVTSIKFIQLAPGEYFISTIKIAGYGGLLSSIPIIGTQLICFILPGLNKNEKDTVLPLIFLSVTLLVLGIFFSYKILIPAALAFFINYSSQFVEPLWSFDEYLNFVSLLLFTTGITFEIPMIQIVLGLADIISSQQMINVWKYVLVGSTVIGAILTPSTDPITQVCLSVAILFLYAIGILILRLYNK
jgi:sec-independent protein translocase protein TatC